MSNVDTKPRPLDGLKVCDATWFGAGLMPKAPGTWGAMAALPLAWILGAVGGQLALLIGAFLAFSVGWWASNVYLTRFGAMIQVRW